MNNRACTIFFCALCTVMIGGLIYVAAHSRAEVTITSGEGVVKYREFTYKLYQGETFIDVLTDSSLLARIRKENGDIRFAKPLERK